jgi:hypothetical protein
MFLRFSVRATSGRLAPSRPTVALYASLRKVLRWIVPKVRPSQRAANASAAGKNQSFVAAAVRTQSARRASAQRLEDAMKFFPPFQHLAVAIMTFLVSATVPHIGQTAEFTLMPSPQTVHIGHFASNLKPVLVDSFLEVQS